MSPGLYRPWLRRCSSAVVLRSEIRFDCAEMRKVSQVLESQLSEEWEHRWLEVRDSGMLGLRRSGRLRAHNLLRT